MPKIPSTLEFEDIARNFLCGDVLAHGTLAGPQRALIILAALAASQTLNAIPRYTLAALDIGAKAEEIKEWPYTLYPLYRAGKSTERLRGSQRGLSKSGDYLSSCGQSTVTEDIRFEKGWPSSKQLVAKTTSVLCGRQRHRISSIYRIIFQPTASGIFIPEGR